MFVSYPTICWGDDLMGRRRFAAPGRSCIDVTYRDMGAAPSRLSQRRMLATAPARTIACAATQWSMCVAGVATSGTSSPPKTETRLADLISIIPSMYSSALRSRRVVWAFPWSCGLLVVWALCILGPPALGDCKGYSRSVHLVD